jgi:hypothetical protein
VHTDVTSHVAICKRTGERTPVNLSNPGQYEFQAHLHNHENIEKIVLIAAQDMHNGLGHSTLQLGTPDLSQAGKGAIGGVKDPIEVRLSEGQGEGGWWMFDGALAHGAGPNTTNERRIVYCLTYVSPEAKLVHGVSPNELLCHQLERRKLTGSLLHQLNERTRQRIMEAYENYAEALGGREEELSLYQAWRFLVDRLNVSVQPSAVWGGRTRITINKK